MPSTPSASIQTLHRIATSNPVGGRQADALLRAQHLVDGALTELSLRLETLGAQAPSPAREAIQHLMGAGGKRLRPLLTLLAARASGGESRHAVPCAVAAELVHNATLLHDDVVDDGTTRRGLPAPRVLWGNTVSVLAGDLLLVAALQQVDEAPGQVRTELVATMGQMVEGEVIQLAHRGQLDLDRAAYEQIIHHKTASLFRWCARAGALVAGAEPTVTDALGRFGHHVGMAFQLRDDVLDLTGDPARTGKGLAADLAEGKLTLPVIVALEHEPSLASILRRLVHPNPALADVAAVVQAVRRHAGLEGARQRMGRELDDARAALRCVPRSVAV